MNVAVKFIFLAALFALLVRKEGGDKDNFFRASSYEIASQVAEKTIILFGLVLFVGFLTHLLTDVPRLWFLSWFVLSVFTGVCLRTTLFLLVGTRLRRGHLCDRVAIIGTGLVADQLQEHIRSATDVGLKLVAVFDDILADDQISKHALDRILEMGRKQQLDKVILTLPASAEARIFEIIYRLRALDVEVAYCPSLLSLGGASLRMTKIVDAYMAVLARRPIDRWGRIVKGIEDRVLATSILVFTAPVFVIIAVAIRLDSPGPVLFRQRRHGWNNSEFQVLKFRTMVWKNDFVNSGEFQTLRGDSRVTRVGAFLRRTSLDELPQLFNVINGTMSLVGPRPHPVVMRTEQKLGEEIIAEYSHRHRVKPGITGWAQINGHRGATETTEQIRKRVEYDIYYIDHWSFFLDIKIMLLTPYILFFRNENAF